MSKKFVILASLLAVLIGGPVIAQVAPNTQAATYALLGTTFTAGGGISAGTITGTALVVPGVAPVVTNAGAATGATMHSVLGTCAFSASVTCTPTAFSNSAVFTSATSFSCSASGGAGTFGQVGALTVATQSTTGIIITAATSNSQTVTYVCTGT